MQYTLPVPGSDYSHDLALDVLVAAWITNNCTSFDALEHTAVAVVVVTR